MKKSISRLTLAHLQKELAQASDQERARNLAWFFKTGKGEYGEGDVFCGITVPVMRKIAKRHLYLKLSDIKKLLGSPIHEHRSVGLEILVFQYEAGDAATKDKLFYFYLKNTSYVNNWDLVDASAPYIVGEQLLSKSRESLYQLARSSNLWERRIAIVATLALIRNDQLKDTFAISKLLLNDRHDLIHKAVGWMLRETGKRSTSALLNFLEENYAALPRTALRYAIERLPEAQRKRILKGIFGGPTRLAAKA